MSLGIDIYIYRERNSSLIRDLVRGDGTFDRTDEIIRKPERFPRGETKGVRE